MEKKKSQGFIELFAPEGEGWLTEGLHQRRPHSSVGQTAGFGKEAGQRGQGLDWAPSTAPGRPRRVSPLERTRGLSSSSTLLTICSSWAWNRLTSGPLV